MQRDKLSVITLNAAKKYTDSHGGGGGGGTTNYNELSHKPSINSTTLEGNLTLANLGIADASTVEGILDGTDIDSFGDVESALSNKVDKVSGKSLSDNNYSDADKTIVDGVTTALSGKADASTVNAILDGSTIDSFADVETALADKVDKVNGKGLSTEDYTTAEKTKLSGIETGADVNVIESITLNGTAVSPDANKNVDLTVITKAVNDLENYYTKSNTYTKTEVDTLINAITTLNLEVVQTLPTTDISTTTIYLVPKGTAQTQNVYDEYICLDATTTPATWEKIGDTEVDLTNYVQKSSTAGLLKNDGTVDTTQYVSDISGKVDKITNPTAQEVLLVNNDGGIASSGIQFGAMQRKAFNSPIDIDGHSASNVEQAINSLNWYKVNLSDFAGQFDSSVSYNVGDYVIYQSDLYKCTTAHTGAWDSTHFTAVILADEVSNKPDNDNVIANTQLLSDTVGYTNKNKIKITATSTEIFTVDSDAGTVLVNGSPAETTSIAICTFEIGEIASGNYILSGCPNGGSSSTYELRVYDSTSSATVVSNYGGESAVTLDSTHKYRVQIYGRGGATITNKLFKPMLRDASILDSTFEPYRNTTAFPRDEQRILGAKNLDRTGRNNSVNHEITYTVNSDGSVTANGTANEDSYLTGNPFTATYTGMVKLTGGYSSSFMLYPIDVTDNARPYADATMTTRLPSDAYQKGGAPLAFYMIAGHEYKVSIRIKNTTQLTNVTIYPMLTLLNDTDLTYAPATMTNKELENEIRTIQSEKSDIENVIANTQLIKDTVGWVSKNKAKIAITSREGFTITDNNGVVTISGTNTSGDAILIVIGTVTLKAGTYKISGSVGGSSSTYGLRISPQGTTTAIVNNYTGISTFTISTDGVYEVKARFAPRQTAYTDVVFSPMVYDADIVDSSFEPYSGTTAFPRDEQAVMGSVNDFEVSLAKLKSLNTTGTWSSNTYTLNNVVFTVNSDGTISATGQASSIAYLDLDTSFDTTKFAGWYLSGLPSSGNADTHRYRICASPSDRTALQDFNTTDKIVDNGTGKCLSIRIASGYNPNGAVFSTMVSLANVPYVPYAMTNKELTDRVARNVNIATWGNYKAVDDVINLTESIDNFSQIIFAIGRNNAAAGIQAITIPNSYNVYNLNTYLFLPFYKDETTFRYIRLQIVSKTQLKIVATNITSDNDDMGIRIISGIV